MNLFYREIRPSKDVFHLVLSFWEFFVTDGDFAPIQHEIVPDGCISLFYRRNENLNLRQLAFSGLIIESVTVPVFPNDIFWGMRLSPASCANILQANPAKFTNKRILEASLFPHLTTGLLEKLNICKNFDEAVPVLENHLEETDLKHIPDDEKIAQALEIIEQTNGEIKIHEIADEIGLSVRQLERRFKKMSGLSPKQFARTRRIRAAAVSLVENDNENWANRAAEIGFADQAHLTREFVSVTKRSPNSFAKKVSQIKHGNLVK